MKVDKDFDVVAQVQQNLGVGKEKKKEFCLAEHEAWDRLRHIQNDFCPARLREAKQLVGQQKAINILMFVLLSGYMCFG